MIGFIAVGSSKNKRKLNLIFLNSRSEKQSNKPSNTFKMLADPLG